MTEGQVSGRAGLTAAEAESRGLMAVMRSGGRWRRERVDSGESERRLAGVAFTKVVDGVRKRWRRGGVDQRSVWNDVEREAGSGNDNEQATMSKADKGT